VVESRAPTTAGTTDGYG